MSFIVKYNHKLHIYILSLESPHFTNNVNLELLTQVARQLGSRLSESFAIVVCMFESIILLLCMCW